MNFEKEVNHGEHGEHAAKPIPRDRERSILSDCRRHIEAEYQWTRSPLSFFSVPSVPSVVNKVFK